MNPVNPPQNLSSLSVGARPAAATPDPRTLPGGVSEAETPIEAGQLAHELLKEQIDSINLWAKNNRSEAKWESFWFWALKVPVIVASAGYGLMLKLNLGSELALAGAVSAACVLIDGLYRPGNLRNFHHRAYFELRMLADDLSDQWNTALLKSDSDINSVAACLIENARRRKAQIAGYLADAEATLGKDAGSPKPKS